MWKFEKVSTIGLKWNEKVFSLYISHFLFKSDAYSLALLKLFKAFKKSFNNPRAFI